MRIETFVDEVTLARRAVELVTAAGPVVALPSGNTPLPVYAEMASQVRAGLLDLGGVTAFGLDELWPVAGDHPGTNRAYFERHLELGLGALRVFDNEAADPEAECQRVAALIETVGGLDLAVVGIGENGHIAFNEPGSAFDSTARVVALERSTRQGFAAAFGSIDDVPLRGLTLGVADILEARRVLLLATGVAKARVVAAALEGPITPALPASALQRHPDLTVLLDSAAAAEL